MQEVGNRIFHLHTLIKAMDGFNQSFLKISNLAI